MAAQREPAAAFEESDLGSGGGTALEGHAAPTAVEIDAVDERVAGARGEVAGAAAQLELGALVDEAQREPVRLERLEPELARAAVLGMAQAPVAPAVGLANRWTSPSLRTILVTSQRPS